MKKPDLIIIAFLFLFNPYAFSEEQTPVLVSKPEKIVNSVPEFNKSAQISFSSFNMFQRSLFGENRFYNNNTFYIQGNPSQGLQYNLNLRVFNEYNKERVTFDLFELHLIYKPANTPYELQLGRQFITSAFYPVILDGIRTSYKFAKPFELEIHAGSPVRLEREEKSIKDYKAGLKGSYFDQAYTASLLLEFEKIKETGSRIYLGSMNQYFDFLNLLPSVYFNLFFEAKEAYLEEISLGAIIFSNSFLVFDLTGYRFERERFGKDILRPFLTTFAENEQYQLSQSGQLNLCKYFSLFEEGSLLLLQSKPDNSERGYEIKSGFSVTLPVLDKGKIYYGYLKSYGGTANSVNANATQLLLKNLSLIEVLNLVTYDKISGIEGKAFNAKTGLSYDFKNLSTELSLEFRSNNEFDRDFYGSLILNYKL